MRDELVCRLALAAAVSLAAVGPAAAQQTGRPDEVRHRNECRLAAQVLTTGNPEPRREWARARITGCVDEGPQVLAAAWASVDADSAELRYLVNNSARIRDERLYHRLRTVASDKSRPDVVRVGAMIVLSRYVDPQNAVWFSDLRAPEGAVRYIPLVLSWSTGGAQLDGARPLGSVGAPVLAALREVAARKDEEPRAVWYAAEVLAKRVQRDIEDSLAR